MVTLDGLKASYAEIHDGIYGQCLVIPAAKFGQGWNEDLKKEGCKIFQGSHDGQSVFFVRLPGQDRQEPATEPRPVYSPPPAPATKRFFEGKPWTSEEYKEVIEGVMLGQTNETIAKRLPDRTPTAVGLCVNRLRKRGALPKAKRGQRRKAIQKAKSTRSIPTSTPTSIPTPMPTTTIPAQPASPPVITPGKEPFNIRTTLQIDIHVNCNDRNAVVNFLEIVKELKEAQNVRAA